MKQDKTSHFQTLTPRLTAPLPRHMYDESVVGRMRDMSCGLQQTALFRYMANMSFHFFTKNIGIYPMQNFFLSPYMVCKLNAAPDRLGEQLSSIKDPF